MRTNIAWLVLLIGTPIFSVSAQTTKLSAAAERFIEAHSNHAATLALEQRIANAVAKNDRATFYALADTATKETLPFIVPDHPEQDELALRLGACQYASIWISVIAYQVAAELRDARGKRVKIKSLLPEDTVESFNENATRCELVKRLPKTVRRLP
jgi:hypothetical protein